MNAYWRKATDASIDAESLLASDRFDGAANRAYYAMFNAVRAVLTERVKLDMLNVRRHSAVLKLFALHIVKPGLIDRRLGKAVNEAFEVRAIADYDTVSVSAAEAIELVDVMLQLLAALEVLLARDPKG